MGQRWLRAVVVAMALCLLPLAGCARGRIAPGAAATQTASASERDYDASLLSGGLTRTYHVHLPPAISAGRPLPLLLSLHGRLGTGANQAKLTDFDAVADANGFIVVYLDGYERSWADGRGTTPADKAGVDDVAFLSAALDQVIAREPVDATRVYVAGMSNGGFMTERLGCDLARRFAAIAVVAADFDQPLAQRCAPTHPLPVMLIHGSADPLVPEAGGPIDGEPTLSMAETVARWVSLAGCSPTPAVAALPTIVADGTSVQRSIYSGCKGGAQVIYYVVIGAGHIWPDGPQYLPRSIIGKTSHNLDASQVIWQFFAAYHL
ncbi:MAG TPA: PHB depolymerase family esterase [Ktedonobacterales bacterium]|nr:PHB depolymerase family esterase [Ktedonobacterales bacterium]